MSDEYYSQSQIEYYRGDNKPNRKVKQCKYCNKTIDKKAKVCPYCQNKGSDVVFGFGNNTPAQEQQQKEIIKGEPYIVKQVVLTEEWIGTGSNSGSLATLQSVINKQVAKGYRLHTISTTSSGSKGLLGGDKIQATLVFERLDMR